MSQIKERTATYIIGKPNNIPANSVELNIDELSNEINNLEKQYLDSQGVNDEPENKKPSAKVIKKLSTKNGLLDALLVEIDEDYKVKLLQRYKDVIIIERDEPIFPLNINSSEGISTSSMQNSILTADTNKLIVTIVVKNSEGKPIKNARVMLSGLLWVDTGFTNRNGKVELTLLDETVDSISSIDIKPAYDYWSLQINRPVIIEKGDNEIILKKIPGSNSGDENTNTKQYVGWGQRDMNLDKIPKKNNPNAKKAKVVVIDSGISADHADLSPQDGFDFGVTKQPTKTWKKDTSGHGTHVAGICAAQNNNMGILGFASDAELISLRIFPNASNSKLMEALDWCIDNKVDVINMSLGGKKASQLVQQRLQACRENGILPIAAAGNNGEKVLFPAAFTEVLSVSAIGRFDSFPEDSSHQKHIENSAIKSGQYFFPGFTCRGPEIDVCAPGVAIVSTVPGNGYAAWDGTSMACPHVAGFAVRLLQTTQHLSSLSRNAERSQKLFDLIIENCKKIDGVPDIFQGSGLPVLPVEQDQDVQPPQIDSHYLNRVSDLIEEVILIIEAQANKQ